MNTLEKARAKVQTAFAKTVNGRFGLEYTPEQLNDLKGLWANAVRQANENVQSGNVQTVQQEGNGTRYNIVTLDNGKEYVEASRKIITGNTVAEMRNEISAFFNEMLKNGDLNVKATDGTTLTITKKETAKKARDKYKYDNGNLIQMSDSEFRVKVNAESHIDELAEISRISNSGPDKKNHSFAKNGFDYRDVYFKDYDGQYYKITLSIGKNNGVATVYNVGKIKTDRMSTGNIISRRVGQSPVTSLSVKNSISENDPTVNTQTEVRNSVKEHDGAKAKSQWTKDAIIAAAREVDSEKADMLQGVSATALKNRLLKQTDRLGGTKLYSFDENALLTLTDFSEMEKLTPHSKSIRAVTQEAIRNLNNTQAETGRYSTEWNAKDIEEAVEGTQKKRTPKRSLEIFKAESILSLYYYFFAVVITAELADSVRHYIFAALGALNHVGRVKFPVSASFISSGFRYFTLRYCH